MMKRVVRLVLLSCIFLPSSGRLSTQTISPNQTSPNRFPYAFNNFVWWNDAALRADLKRLIPTLGDDLVPGSQVETKVRTVLVSLLKEKGVQAEVQAFEPSKDAFSATRAPGAPPISIVFSVLAPPEIVVEKLVLDNPPPESASSLNVAASRMQGRPYAATSFWSNRQQITDGLQQVGYLSATIDLESGTPRKEGDRYLVPVTALLASGPKYHVSSVKADGGPLFQGKDMSPYFSLKPGDVATPQAFGRLINSLRSAYWHAGYPDVDFRGAPVLDIPRALASYQLEVIPGPIYHLRGIRIENLSPQEEAQARSLFALKDGDIYDGLAVAMFGRKVSEAGGDLKGYGVSYRPNEDKQTHLVDLTLSFYKQ